MEIGEDLHAHAPRLARVPKPVVITESTDAALVTALTTRAWHGTADPRSSGHRLKESDVSRLLADVSRLLAGGAVALVARDAAGEAVGSVVLERVGDSVELMKLAVPDGNARRRGIASGLIDAAVAWANDAGADRLVLAVSLYQPRLVGFYARRGFVVDPARQYRNAAPGSPSPIVMVRELGAGRTAEDPVGDAASALLSGGLVILPTETVYGLGALASDPVAVRRVFAIKGRPVDHPLIVHVSDGDAIERWAVDVPADARRLAAALWPGPLTLVLHRHPDVPLEVTGGLDTVALRVPGHPAALAVLGLLPPGSGIAAPSANRFGRVSPTTAAAAVADLGALLAPGDLVLDGGACRVGIESTILDLTGEEPSVLRPGGMEAERIEQVLGRPVRRIASGPARAPGMLAAHYAPRAGVLVSTRNGVGAAIASASSAGRVGVLAPVATELPEGVIRLPAPDPYDGAGLAPVLYERLRQADGLGLAALVVVAPPDDGLGWAVGDRLRRAATGSPVHADAQPDGGTPV
jgi:L-threonylcarbamoyladenylate synthase